MKACAQILLALFFFAATVAAGGSEKTDDADGVSRSIHIMPDGIICTMAWGEGLESSVSGPDLCSREEFAPFWAAQDEMIGGAGWEECQDSPQHDDNGAYDGCFVAIYPDNGQLPSTRDFTNAIIPSEAMCQKWCSSHWPVPGEGTFDRLYSCTGDDRDHKEGEDHEPYTLGSH